MAEGKLRENLSPNPRIQCTNGSSKFHFFHLLSSHKNAIKLGKRPLCCLAAIVLSLGSGRVGFLLRDKAAVGSCGLNTSFCGSVGDSVCQVQNHLLRTPIFGSETDRYSFSPSFGLSCSFELFFSRRFPCQLTKN